MRPDGIFRNDATLYLAVRGHFDPTAKISKCLEDPRGRGGHVEVKGGNPSKWDGGMRWEAFWGRVIGDLMG